MNATRVLLVASFAALVAAQECGQGTLVDGCCVCFAGWKASTKASTPASAAAPCDTCAEGYVYDESNNVCSNGRAGSACTDDGGYPYWGCGNVGKCSAGGVFPCICEGGNCEQVAAQNSASCYPAGTRMYTTFPNQPTMDKPYSLTFVGCQLTTTDRYAVIPAYTDDLSAERPCAALGANNTGGLTCVFNGAGPEVEVADANKTGACTGGFVITGLREQNEGANQGMTEFTFKDITMGEKSFGGSLQDRAANNGGGVNEKETYFRVCKLTQVTARDGSQELAWAEVANHDVGVSKRDFVYQISREPIYDPWAAAAGDDEEGADCCDGLKLGSLCLPLWVLLLLWLLMACCLGVMGYTLHKNKNEIEAQKNNEKYEKFNVDAEMSAMAAKQAEDDDDI